MPVPAFITIRLSWRCMGWISSGRWRCTLHGNFQKRAGYQQNQSTEFITCSQMEGRAPGGQVELPSHIVLREVAMSYCLPTSLLCFSKLVASWDTDEIMLTFIVLRQHHHQNILIIRTPVSLWFIFSYALHTHISYSVHLHV